MVSIVVAMDRNRGIGLNGQLPWRLLGDMKFFREVTTCPDRVAIEERYFGNVGALPLTPNGGTGAAPTLPLPPPDSNNRNAVLMGRVTWEGLPAAFRPLPKRFNGVLSRSAVTGESDTHQTWASLESAVAALNVDTSIREIYIIGGAQIYAEALNSWLCDRLYITEIDSGFSCDTFFPEIPSRFHETASSTPIEEDGVRYRFTVWQSDIK